MKTTIRFVRALAHVAIAATVCAGCAKKQSTLMPTPALYAYAAEDLSEATADVRKTATIEILYATDRQYDPSQSPAYPPERERFLRLGAAEVQVGSDDMGWPELLAASTSGDRNGAIPLQLTRVEDFGPLAESTIPFDPISRDPTIGDAGRRYAELINDRLADSQDKDIYILISPFKVRFDQVTCMAAEFHHYLGRDGVFIAYSWPSREGNLSYLNAAENAYRTRRCLRVFFEYLAATTNAERIHFITYSAGARVLSGAVHQLILTSQHMNDEEMREHLPVGQIVFCAPDIDSGAFLEHVVEGLGRFPGRTTCYTNPKDGALRLSRKLYGNNRLGLLDVDDLQQGKEVLLNSDQISFVSVMHAEDANVGNGHGYFRLSPWVSTDILLMLGRGLAPAERGLTRASGDPIWHFPDDYRERIRGVIDASRSMAANPPDARGSELAGPRQDTN